MPLVKIFCSQVGKVDELISVSAQDGLAELHVCVNNSYWFQYVNLAVEGGAFLLVSN